jgi:uncharacterized protein (DUF4415 family)
MSKTEFRTKVDLDHPSPWTKQQREELEKLRARQDEDIDLTDMPELTDSFFENAVQRNLYRPVKTSTTVRIDSEVIVWLKSYGKGYQTRINAILRDAMIRDRLNKVPKK